MNEQNNPKTPKTLKFLIIVNVLILIAVGSLFYLVLQNKNAISSLGDNLENNYVDKEQYEKLKVNIPNAIGLTPTDTTPDDTPLMAYEPVTYTGVIKKEKIPEEYALGDNWYIFYFDEPQLIDTAAGKMYRDSLQVEASGISSLDEYLDLDVTLNGRLSYGYAESRIILVDEVSLN